MAPVLEDGADVINYHSGHISQFKRIATFQLTVDKKWKHTLSYIRSGTYAACEQDTSLQESLLTGRKLYEY